LSGTPTAHPSHRMTTPSELADQLVTLTQRAALMDAQLEILEGKKRSAARL